MMAVLDFEYVDNDPDGASLDDLHYQLHTLLDVNEQDHQDFSQQVVVLLKRLEVVHHLVTKEV